MTARFAYLAILARLEILRIRAFWRFASRDLVFDVCVVAGAAILYGTLHRGFELALKAPPAVAAALAVAVGAALALAFQAGPDSAARKRLNDGPLHDLVVAPGAMTLWMSVRAAGFALLSIGVLAAVLATMDLAGAGAFLALAAAGALTAAAAALVRPAVPTREPKGGEGAARPSRGPWLTARAPLAIVALSALRGGRMPPWLVAPVLVGVGGVAGRLAVQNNHAPQLGLVIAAVTALLAGTLFLPRGRLPGLLGQQPPALARIYLWLAAAPLSAAASGGAVAALLCGLGPIGAAEAGFTGAVGLAILTWFYFLHRLIRSQRFAATGAALEFVAALFMATVDTSLGPFWLAVRGLVLVRAAGRRRWLDR